MCGCNSQWDSNAAVKVTQWEILDRPTDGLAFEPSSLELPDLTVNTSCDFSLLVRNMGTEKVIVERVSAGCTCTNVTISDPVIEPGRHAKITGIFKAGR